MTQSDSSDFEFDISNLEVVGGDAATTEPGEKMPVHQEAVEPIDPEGKPSSGPVLDPEVAAEFESAAGFDIDALPDPFSAAPASPSSDAIEEVTGEARPIPPSATAAGSRRRRRPSKGADDLGGEVFAEIDEDAEAPSFEDALEDLLEEVDEYEIGGYDEAAEALAAQAANGASDEIFKLDDPDDSLTATNGVRPQAPSVAANESSGAGEAESSAARSELNRQSLPATPVPPPAPPSPEPAKHIPPTPKPALAKSPSAITDDFEIPADEAFEVQEESAPEEPAFVSDEGEAPVANDADDDLPLADAEAIGELAPEGPSPEVEAELVAEAEISGGPTLSIIDNDDADEAEPEQDARKEPLPDDDSAPANAMPAPRPGPSLSIIEDDDEIEDDRETEDVAEPHSEPEASSAADLDAAPVADEAKADLLAAAQGFAGGLAVDDSDDEDLDPAAETVTGAGDDAAEPSASEAPISPRPASTEDLLMRASRLLNGDGPASAASSLLDDAELDDDDLIALPDPSSVLNAARDPKTPKPIEGMMILDDDDDDIEEMLPDPQTLMGEATAPAKKPWTAGPSNVADRAGDLPPPPPAPVEIFDDDPLDIDPAVEEAAALQSVDIEAAIKATDGELDLLDPFGSANALEDFNKGLEEIDAFEDALLGEDAASDDPLSPLAAPPATVTVIEKAPKPSLLYRVTHSLAIAAALALMGGAWLMSVWKQEIMEYMEGRDLDGSALLAQIREVSAHALDGFDEQGLYRMQWAESEVKQVADNEIRLHALVGAQLREDLYVPVLESYLRERFGFDDALLRSAEALAQTRFPEEGPAAPVKPWANLYRLASAKDQVLPLRITYRLVRETEKADWELAGVNVRGQKGDLVWPEGRPKHEFGESAYNVDSPEFAKVLAGYKRSANEYVASVDALRQSQEAAAAKVAVENRERRQRVIDSLSKGAFFSGIAILGEDGKRSQDVTMVITDMMENGALVKGVFKVDGDDALSKYFVGTVNFEASAGGRQNGVLSVTTVSFGEAASDEPYRDAFFAASTTSRIRLKADGFRLEGDNQDLSLRLTRSL